jgi:hypothetical protein
MPIDQLSALMATANTGEPLKKFLNSRLACGPSAIEHALRSYGFPAGGDTKVGVAAGFDLATDLDKLMTAVTAAELILDSLGAHRKGIIVQKQRARSKKELMALEAARGKEAAAGGGDGGRDAGAGGGAPGTDGASDGEASGGSGTAAGAAAGAGAGVDEPIEATTLFYDEFQPFLHEQHKDLPHLEYPTFDRAVDVFFSEIEAQKIELRIIAQEDAVIKKLEKVRSDHHKRLDGLQQVQEKNLKRAQLIEMNLDLVDQAIRVINSLLASSMDWGRIGEMVQEAKAMQDPVASHIKSLKLESNQIVLSLREPVEEESSDEEDDGTDDDGADSDPEAAEAAEAAKLAAAHKKKAARRKKQKAIEVEIDLGISAYKNSMRQYENKKAAVHKEKKTIEASEHAMRNAELKTEKALKKVVVSGKINKARKQYWFEKYLWFISSDNYLVVGGRDRQQNEQIVKRYLEKGDVYVHADFHGASTIIIKNPAGGPIAPRTLSEAGSMATTHSSAWESKITIGSYWVHDHQVSKIPPTGEYLTPGSFMVRGKKNFLPPTPLVCGIGLLFKIDESCIVNHLHERKAKGLDDDANNPSPSEEVGPTMGGGGGRRAVTTAVADDGAGAALTPAVSVGSDVECEAESEIADASADEEGGTAVDEDNAFPDTNIVLRFDEGNSLAMRADSAESGLEADEAKPAAPARTPSGHERISAKEKRQRKKEQKRAMADASAGALAGAAAIEDALDPVTPDDAEAAFNSLVNDDSRAASGSAAAPIPAATKDDEASATAAVGVDENRTGKGKGKATGRKKLNAADVKAAKEAKEAKEKQKAHNRATTGTKARGQTAKEKKVKSKYADQDEDEREMAIKLLAASGDIKPQSRKAKRDARKAKGIHGSKHIEATGAQGLEATSAEAAAAIAKVEVQLAARSQAFDGDWDEDKTKAAAESKHAKMRDVVADEEEEEIRKILEDEAIQLLSESERDNLSYLDSFTGIPREDDVIEFAIPVCAPLSALNKYKYKLKMMPGTGRKGQAAKTAVHMWTHQSDSVAREKDLIESVKDAEFTANLPGKVKVMGGAVHKRK